MLSVDSIYSLYQPTAPNFQKFLWLLRNKIDFGLNVFYMVNYYPERYLYVASEERHNSIFIHDCVPKILHGADKSQA